VSVPRINKNKKLPNPFNGKNLIDVQQIKKIEIIMINK